MIKTTIRQWSRRKLSLKGRAKVSTSHIYSILYRLSVLPHQGNEKNLLVPVLFHLLCCDRSPKLRHEVSCLHLSEGGLVMPDAEIR